MSKSQPNFFKIVLNNKEKIYAPKIGKILIIKSKT